MILYFIRHAQSENNVLTIQSQNPSKRHADPVLTAVGETQADLLAKFLKSGYPAGGNGASPNHSSGFGITHLYTSLMVRAVETGSLVAKQLQIPLIGLMDLHECGGIFLEDEATREIRTLPGMGQAYFQEKYPDCRLPDGMPVEGWWAGRPFEMAEERQLRAQRVIEYLLENHTNPADRIAVISHADFYNEFLRAVLTYNQKTDVWFTIHNTGITRVDFREEGRRIVYMNRTSHLPPDLLTA